MNSELRNYTSLASKLASRASSPPSKAWDCSCAHPGIYMGIGVLTLAPRVSIASALCTKPPTHSPFFFISPRSDHKGQQGIVNKRKNGAGACYTVHIYRRGKRICEFKAFRLCDELQTDPAWEEGEKEKSIAPVSVHRNTL